MNTVLNENKFEKVLYHIKRQFALSYMHDIIKQVATSRQEEKKKTFIYHEVQETIES